jgi:hypothetical protein
LAFKGFDLNLLRDSFAAAYPDLTSLSSCTGPNSSARLDLNLARPDKPSARFEGDSDWSRFDIALFVFDGAARRNLPNMLPGEKVCFGGGVVVVVVFVVVFVFVALLMECSRLENKTPVSLLLLLLLTEEVFVPFPMLKRSLRISCNSISSPLVNWREIDGLRLLLLLRPVPLPKKLLKLPGRLVWVKLKEIAGVMLLFVVLVQLLERLPSCTNEDVLVI